MDTETGYKAPKMNKKIVLQYSTRYGKPYEVVKAVNTVQWEVGQRLSKDEVEAIIQQIPQTVNVEIVK